MLSGYPPSDILMQSASLEDDDLRTALGLESGVRYGTGVENGE